MIFIIWTRSCAAGWTKCVCMCICNHPHMVFCKPCSSSGHGRCCRSHVHLLRIHLTSSESKLVLRGSVYCRTVPLCRAPPHFDLLPLDKVINARAKCVSLAFQNKMTEHINEYSHQSASISTPLSILRRPDESPFSPQSLQQETVNLIALWLVMVQI